MRLFKAVLAAILIAACLSACQPINLFPAPTSTGVPAGVTLTPYTGPCNIIAPGTVIDAADIRCVLKISAPDVTVKRSRITASGTYGINQNESASPLATNLTVSDVEITSTVPGDAAQMIDRAALVTNSATFSRIYVHGTVRGVQFRGTTGLKTLQDSYVGDNVNPSTDHTSAVMTDGGTSGVRILHNTLRTAPNTHPSSAVSIYPQTFAGGSNDDWVLDSNLFDSAADWCAYLGGDPTSPKNTHMTVTNNVFGNLYHPLCGLTGAVASWDLPTNTWSGNVYQSDQSPVNAPGT